MDIIKQRVENINQISKLNNSLNNQIDAEINAPLTAAAAADKFNKNVAVHTSVSNIVNDPLSTPAHKPLKRKLFTPPAFNFNQTNGFADDKATPKKSDRDVNIDMESTKKQKSMKNALYDVIGERPASKRVRDDDVMLQSNQTKRRKTFMNTETETKTKTIEAEPKYTPGNLRRSTRRSTMNFRIVEKVKEPNLPKKNRRLSEQVMVFTNMHQPQINNIEKVDLF